MKELTVFEHNHVDVVDSRQVAEMIGKTHAHLMRDIQGYVEILKKSIESKFGFNDFFIESTYKDSIGRTLPCYLLTKKGCDMVANKMTGEKGVLFTAAYVTAFEAMRQHLDKGMLALPKDYPSALRALADAEEQRQALLAENTANKPKVIFADAVSASERSILVGELAKLLRQNGVEIGQNRLFDWMRKNGFLIRRQGIDYNMPTQKAMEMGLFEIKETSVVHSAGNVTINKTPKVTGKGQVYFINRFLDRNNHESENTRNPIQSLQEDVC